MGQKLTREEALDFTVRAVFNFAAEFMATASLVFVGCLTCFFGGNNELAAAFGFGMVMAIEIAINVSGGHVNPMATVACLISGYLTVPMAIIYILGQLCGSIIGFGLVIALPPPHFLQDTQPDGPCLVRPRKNLHQSQAFFFEFIGSSLWILVFCAQWDPRHKGAREGASIKLGLSLYALIVALGPFSGGSINPARAFAPALWNNYWSDLWIYWVSAMLAAIIWPLMYSRLIIKYAPYKKELTDGYKHIEAERERRKLERERERALERGERDRLRRERAERAEREKEKEKEKEKERSKVERDSSP